ncbi:hypothetical protein BDQ17DRAFT_178487 [Cyathus striatus]|nr:hypothetical protein BDQ17DRAFT_178487 [Cyathus striatus]
MANNKKSASFSFFMAKLMSPFHYCKAPTLKKMPELTLYIHNNGSNQRKGTVELQATIPEDIEDNLQQLVIWANNLIQLVATDLKHTNQWGCMMCQRPATEVKLASQSFIHYAKPYIILHMFQLCRAGDNRCSLEVNNICSASRLASNGVLRSPIEFPKATGRRYSLSSSCANCLQDDTAREDISRCGGCKLVRYCSRECQQVDWPRHSSVCNIVRTVRWEGWC